MKNVRLYATEQDRYQVNDALDERLLHAKEDRYRSVPVPSAADRSIEAAVRWSLGSLLQDRPAFAIGSLLCLVWVVVRAIYGLVVMSF